MRSHIRRRLFQTKSFVSPVDEKRDDVCLVAEVRDGRENIKKEKHLASLQLWEIWSILHLKLTVLVTKVLARLLPLFFRSYLTNREVCTFFRVPWLRIKNVNAPDFVQRLSSMRPDVVVSMQRQIFGTNILAVSKIACINCHPSKLPKYRGFWPILLAMINGDETIGVTVHMMTRKIDMGAIVAQGEFVTSPNFSLMDNYRLAYELYPEVICEAIDLLKEKNITDFPCAPADTPYYPGPTAAEMERFQARGLRML
ncbi:MAG: hypothetical protein JRC90_07290 [Deltaproteobacteria bacterium]|nr:hypothetical protein [Deltaproteobacteria bacterium]